MRVDGRISAGYAIVCECGEAFAQERIGLTLECPSCGRTELGTEVVLDYYLTRADEADPAPLKGAAG